MVLKFYYHTPPVHGKQNFRQGEQLRAPRCRSLLGALPRLRRELYGDCCVVPILCMNPIRPTRTRGIAEPAECHAAGVLLDTCEGRRCDDQVLRASHLAVLLVLNSTRRTPRGMASSRITFAVMLLVAGTSTNSAGPARVRIRIRVNLGLGSGLPARRPAAPALPTWLLSGRGC